MAQASTSLGRLLREWALTPPMATEAAALAAEGAMRKRVATVFGLAADDSLETPPIRGDVVIVVGAAEEGSQPSAQRGPPRKPPAHRVRAVRVEAADFVQP